MICKKCNGQGVVTKVMQLDGDACETVMCAAFGLMSLGTTLLFTTKIREVTCTRCGGAGRISYER